MKATELIETLEHYIGIYGDHDIRIDGDVNETEICFHVWMNEFIAISNSNAPL